MAENVEQKIPQEVKPVMMTLSEKKEKIELCAIRLKNNQMDESSAYLLSSHLFKDIEIVKEADEIIKIFQDRKFASFTIDTGKGGTDKHTHGATLMVLNFGDHLVGVTTSTNKGGPHIHAIKLNLDSKIISVEANTNFGAIEKIKDGAITFEDNHRHPFKAMVEQIRSELPMITTSSFFNENKGNGEKDDNSDTGNKYLNEAVNIETPRQAEMLMLKISQNDNDHLTDKIKDSIIGICQNKYPDHFVFDDSNVAEMILSGHLERKKKKKNGTKTFQRKIDPKAKVRTRPSPIFPAGSADVTDNKDHFPIDTAGRARNALARAAQFKKSPPWFKGSLAALQQKVRRAVKRKFPTIKVTGLSEYLALRFKEGSDIYFCNLPTLNVETAKHDAKIYRTENPYADVNIVKFSLDDNGKSLFNDLGKIILYDMGSKFSKEWEVSSSEIKLADVDKQGRTVIEILREGEFEHEVYGHISVTNDTMQEIVKNFDDNVLEREVSFDRNHMSDFPAACWVKQLSIGHKDIRDNKRFVLKAHVELTPGGRESIENKEYKYFSAEYSDTFVSKEDGKKFGTTLKGGGFTNRPWMPGLAPIQLSDASDNVALIKRV